DPDRLPVRNLRVRGRKERRLRGCTEGHPRDGLVHRLYEVGNLFWLCANGDVDPAYHLPLLHRGGRGLEVLRFRGVVSACRLGLPRLCACRLYFRHYSAREGPSENTGVRTRGGLQPDYMAHKKRS